MKYTLLVDADELLYTSAFSVEKTAYKINVGGKVYNFCTKYKRDEIITKMGLKGKAPKLDYEIITYKVPTGPVEYALASCKNKLTHLESVGSDIRLFLTADNRSNFRYDIAKTEGPNGQGYKAGRPPRPIYYSEVRNYLLKRGAEEVEGCEADDALGINQNEQTVVVHQDKDINRILGRHYNWKTRERYIVKDQLGKLWLNDKRKLKGVGNAWFFAQMLLGDRIDNIPTIIGYDSSIDVYKMLEKCKTELDYFQIIEDCYYNQYGNNYKEYMLEMADLLYIMDSEQIRGSQYLHKLHGKNTLQKLVDEAQELDLGY